MSAGDGKKRARAPRIMIAVPVTVEERDMLREASSATGIPQATFLRDAGLEMAGRKLWEVRRKAAEQGRKTLPHRARRNRRLAGGE